MLKTIHRTYVPSSGRMLFRTRDGEELDLARVDEHRITELRRREIGFVTQFLHAPPRRPALDVVAQPLLAVGTGREDARRRAAELLERLRVPERLWALPPATFSGGEKQRINLARGMAARPRLMLLDEPTASLDAETARCVADLIAELKQQGTGVVAVFHDRDLVEMLADQQIHLQPWATREHHSEDVL